MANNHQFSGVPGPPLHPSMIGAVGLPQNLPPHMPAQFRTVSSVHPMQQFASSVSQQYQPLGSGIHALNVGMPPPPTQQMQFAQSMQQAPARPIPQGHPLQVSQSITVSNIQLNRPMPSGLPQPVQNFHSPSNFVPASGGLGMSLPPSYALNAYPASQFQHVVTQMNNQSNPVPRPPLLASGNQGAASVAPMRLDEQPSATNSTISAVNLQPKPVDHSSSDWLEHTNNGRRYYYNKKTRLSTWERPLELMTPLERADATTDWKEFTSPDGRTYYFNKTTKQSKWIIPEELKLVRDQAKNPFTVTEVTGNPNVSAQPFEVKTPTDANTTSGTTGVLSSPAGTTPVAGAVTSPASRSPGSTSLPHEDLAVQTVVVEAQLPAETLSTIAAGSVVSGNGDAQAVSSDPAVLPTNESDAPLADQDLDSQKNIAAQDAKEANKNMDVPDKMDATPSDEKSTERETVPYANKQEAKDVFKSLLESVNVESDWSWDQTMRLIINDKRYAALRSLGERKQTFNEYLGQRKKQDVEERRAKNKNAKDDFRKMLQECSELTSTARWGKALNMFGDDERFIAIERGRDRQDMFEEYLAELQKKELAKEEEEHQRDITDYQQFLKSCDFIKANSQWRKVKDRLEVDQRWLRLETIERLKIFQDYIGDLEKEEEEQRRLVKEETRKAERKNRDEFRKLMEGHVADGTLTPKSLWRDYHAQVKDTPTYQLVSSNSSGSTPKELFEDVLEEIKKQYREDKTLIKDALTSGKVLFTSTWTLEEFKAALGKEISSPEVSENNLKMVFEELVEKSREKEEREARKRKRLGDAFFNMLCTLKDLTADLSWEECLPLFEAREEFRLMGDESFSKQILDEYLVQLKEVELEKERKRQEEKVRKEKERERGRDRRSKDRREKDRKHDRDRGRERSVKDDGDGESDFNEFSNEIRKSGKDKEKRHRKRHNDEDNDVDFDKNGKDHSRSSHRHSSERNKSRHGDQSADMPESDNESKHKKHKKEHRNGSRKRADTEELEDGELGNW